MQEHERDLLEVLMDPGILTYLMRRGHLTGQQLDDLLNTKSGRLPRWAE